MAPALPTEDRLLARLAQAETGSEECDLLGRVPASDDDTATFAITDVLARTRFESVRACATEALTKQPTPPAQSWLVDLSSDPNADVHRPALEALAERDEAAQSAVIEAAHSENEDIAEDAVIALLEAKQSSAFSAAVALLASATRAQTLASLVDALGKSEDSRALPVLTDLIAHADHDTHLAAIAALGDLGEKRAEPLLESLLVTGSRNELETAAQALATLDPALAAQKLRAAEDSSQAERSALALSSLISLKLAGADAELARALQSGESAQTRAALAQLDAKPDPALEPLLAALASNADASVSRLAVRALSRIDTQSARVTLERLGEDENLADFVAQEQDRAAPTDAERRAARIRNLERGRGHPLVELAGDRDPEAQAAVLRHLRVAECSPSELLRVVEAAPASLVEQVASQLDPAQIQQRLAFISGLSERGDPRFAESLRVAARASQLEAASSSEVRSCADAR